MSILELVLAMTVMLGALLTIAHAGTAGIAVVANSRQRQTASGLGSKAIETIRALPFDTLSAGHDTGDLNAATTVGSATFDSNIKKNGTLYYYTHGDSDPANDELMPNVDRTPDDKVPWVDPMVTEDAATKIDGVQYRVNSYVSLYKDPSTASFRVTTIVSWRDPGAVGGRSSLMSQSVAASPNGCLSTTTHPFAGPCRAFFYGVAGLSNAAIAITGADGSPVAGLTMSGAQVDLPTHLVTLQLEQTQSVSSRATASGARITNGSTVVDESGYESSFTQASNDANLSVGSANSSTLGPSTGSARTISGPSGLVRVVPGIDDVGSTISTTEATGPVVCKDEAAATLATSSPCANSLARQVGAGSYPNALVEMQVGGATGPWMLASVAPPGSDDNWSRSYRDNGVTPVQCSTTTAINERCIRSAAKRKLGNVNLAALPSGVTGPPGWNGALVHLSGFTDTVMASGGKGTPTGPSGPSATVAGTISYWNGSGYSSMTSLSTPDVSIPVDPVEVDVPALGPGFKIKITSALRVGGVAYVDSGCPTPNPCSRTRAQAVSRSPILGQIRYTVTDASGTLADLYIQVDLGTLIASATYKGPPSAV